VDVTLPVELRQKALQETYNFICNCTLCTGVQEVDMRSSYFCPKCEQGLVAVKDRGRSYPYAITTADSLAPGKASLCSKCGAALVVSDDLKEKLRVAIEGLQKAEKIQSTGE